MKRSSRRDWLREASVLAASGVVGCTSTRNLEPQTPADEQGADARMARESATNAERPSSLPEDPASTTGTNAGAEEEQPEVSASDPTSEVLEVLPRIYIQPLGLDLLDEDVRFVVGALQVFFPHPVVKSDPLPLPKEAYYPPRSRYRAEKILEFLEQITGDDAQVVMGLTQVDISTTKPPYEDWGILGLATVGGKQCVISRFRAQRGARDEIHTRIRLAKTVVHEVGHTLGLRHCANHGCLMEDGKGTVRTTDHEFDLCASCRAQVAQHLRPLDEGALPWPRPE